nr:hypothetical protein [Natrarchaeobaculum sulfurireducens]
MDDHALKDRLARLSYHLEATAELPVDRQASRWLGEAEAVARDLERSDLDRETVARRVAKVQDLLDEVDETGHADADEHLVTARRECVDLLES